MRNVIEELKDQSKELRRDMKALVEWVKESCHGRIAQLAERENHNLRPLRVRLPLLLPI